MHFVRKNHVQKKCIIKSEDRHTALETELIHEFTKAIENDLITTKVTKQTI